MARKTIYTKVKDVLRARILAGEYLVRDLPGERKIAAETGVSYMTARKAVTELIDERVLARRPNGTLIVHPSFRDEHAAASAVLLVPAYPSSHLARCRIEIGRIATEHRVRLRTIEYTYWYDSIVTDALEGTDGLFIIPSTEELPTHLIDAFTDPTTKTVFFDADMSEHGIVSIRLFAGSHFEALFEHLWETGRRQIGCLNTQGHNDEILQRLETWRTWLEGKGGEGELLDHPVEPFGDPLEHGYRVLTDRISAGQALPEALVCTTYPAAVGAIRALRDAGIAVGPEVAVCAMNIEFPGRYGTPSMTGLEFPDIEPLLANVFEWFKGGSANWKGDRLVEPAKPSLFIGESTQMKP
jgi:DNA-binding LacI/PurR family transcriptional regulator